jgi:hypothetical protein
MSFNALVLLIANGAGFVAFLAALFLLRRRSPEVAPISLFFAVWAFVVLFEFFFLGENSFINMNEEGELAIPHLRYLADRHPGGQFSYAMGGGIDLATFIIGAQNLSFDLIFFSLLPQWLAIFFHKLVVVTVGFFGTYLLCRDTTHCNKGTAVAVATWFTVSTYYLIIVTYGVGAGLAFVPLLIHVCVARMGRRFYFSLVALTAVGASGFMIPTNNLPVVVISIVFSAFLFKRLDPRLIASLFIVIVIALINWGDSLYAIATIAPFTEKVVALETSIGQRLAEALLVTPLRLYDIQAALLVIPVILLLWRARDPLWWRGALVLLGPIGAFLLLKATPWELVGLAPLNNVSYHYILLAIVCLILPLMARAATILNDASFPQAKDRDVPTRRGTVLVLAMAIGMVAFFKTHNFAYFLYHGGQSQYHSVGPVIKYDWRPSEPSRVITLRTPDMGPEPNLAYGAYGLDSFDAFQLMAPKQHSAFWNHGLLKGQGGWGFYADWSRWKDGRYEASGQLSTDLLRTANVGYVLSPLPFSDGFLKLVRGPSRAPVTRADLQTQPGKYFRDRLSRLIDINDLYVYALEDTIPRVFAARKMARVNDDLGDEAFLDKVRRHGPDRTIVVWASKAKFLEPFNSDLTVDDYTLGPDSIDIRVSAPAGGVVVVNIPHLPFWRAMADQTPVRPIEVNLIHMALKVPPGTRIVRLSYYRKTLGKKLAGFFGGVAAIRP